MPDGAERRSAHRTGADMRRTAVGLVVLLAGFVAVGAGVAGASSSPSGCRSDATLVTCTFSYDGTDGANGSAQRFVVPAGVTAVSIEAWGTQGGNVDGAVGGPGGYSAGTVAVVPGEVLEVRVGGQPSAATGGYNGGGGAGLASGSYAGAAGGGATDVRQGGDGLTRRIVVAGGGGGSAYSSGMGSLGDGYNDWSVALGGDGGGSSGAISVSCTDSPWQNCGGGGGATGGNVGTTTTSPCGQDGVLGSGGAGCGAGGGGGYYGGGGGGFIDGDCCGLGGIQVVGPGGGGSGDVISSATDVRTGSGLQFGDGMARISFVVRHPHPGLVWSAPEAIDTTGAVLSGISCPSATFCVAVDTGGNAATEVDGTWSAFAPVAGPGNSFVGVSCSSVTFCAAVGTGPQDSYYGQDLAVIYDNGRWSGNTSVTIAPGEILTGVSCARGTEHCIAVGWGSGGPGFTMVSETYDGTAWIPSDDGTGYGGSGDKLTTVSCARTTVCLTGGIVQDRGDIGDWLTFDYHGHPGGGQITNQQVDGIDGEIDTSSCGSVTCMAAGDATFVFTVTRGALSGPTDPDGTSTITGLSCTDSSTCVAVDGNGDTLTARHGVWSAPLSIDPGGHLDSLSCPTETFCLAADTSGNVVVGS